MLRNSFPVLLLLTGCDASVGDRTQRGGEVTIVGIEEIASNSAAPPAAIGAPSAWRVADGAAYYGGADQPPQFALRCDRATQQMIFERAGGGDTLSLSAGGLGSSLQARAAGAGRVQARTSLGDVVLDAMARPQSRISVGGGTEPLAIPGGIAIRRVLDWCRIPPEPEPAPASPEALPGNAVAPAPVATPMM